MTDLIKIKNELEKLGISNRQAEIYLLLVAHKELRIQEIVKLSNIPRSSVYENLRRLYDLGIVEEIVDDAYTRIRAHPIGVMRHAINEKISDLNRQASVLETLATRINLAAADDPTGTNIHYYKGRTGARQIYWNSLKANDTVYVYTEWGRQQYVGIKYYENFVVDTQKHNIKEKVLINLTDQILESIKQYNLPGSSIARTQIDDIRVLKSQTTIIKGDTLIYNDIYAQVYLKDVEINGFEIENHDFVKTQRSIFETLWQSARPISDFL